MNLRLNRVRRYGVLVLLVFSVLPAFSDSPEADEHGDARNPPVDPGSIALILPASVERGTVLRAFVVAPQRLVVEAISARLTRPDGYEIGTHGWRVASADHEGDLWQLLFGIGSDLAPGPAAIYAAITFSDGRTLVIEDQFEIGMRGFREEEIALSFALTSLRTAEAERRAAESRELWSILQTTDLAARYHSGRFIEPLMQYRRTSLFGDRRRYRYADGTRVPSLHNGLDMAAPTGTLIAAAGRGRVAMARRRIVTGNTVVIEHQPGVYSLYYHLERIDVQTGQTVDQGDIIGTVGSTGLSTGPHLHWEVRVAGVPVDPEWFVRAPVVDTEGVRGALSAVP